jgi:energy-coupling factor transport system substrate-specific component
MSADRFKAKDLITIAVLSLIFYAIYILVGSLLWISIVLNPFCVAASILPGGIVWTYMRAKVPKRFGILLQAVLLATICFVAGSGWFVSTGLLVGGALAELVSGVGKYKSFKWNIAGYAAFAVALNLGNYSLMLIARDYYYEYCLQVGFEPGLAEALIGAVNGPVLLLSTTLTAVSAVAGMYLGRAMLKKHFMKAGIV